MVRFGAILTHLERYCAVGAILKYLECYGAVQCDLEISSNLWCGSVRF